MSLHLNQQCQRADALRPPVRLVPGIGCTDQEEARNERETLIEGRVRCCGAPYMCGAQSRQPGFCNYVARTFQPARRAEAPLAYAVGSVQRLRFKRDKPLFYAAFSSSD